MEIVFSVPSAWVIPPGAKRATGKNADALGSFAINNLGACVSSLVTNACELELSN